MRPITLRYQGTCRKCEAILEVGSEAIYEKWVGVYCQRCAPTHAEEIRVLRQTAADAKATKYEGWAEKRRATAEAVLHANAPITSDWAFVTQPGNFPLKRRVYRQNDRAYESLDKAKRFEQKAVRLRRGVRVAGDANAARQATREVVLGWVKAGMMVDTSIYGILEVERVNRKTATVRGRTGSLKVDLSFLTTV